MFFFSLSANQELNAQLFQWAGKMGGNGSEVAHAITTDAAGNIYTTGYYGGTCDFDRGPGVFNLTSNSWSSDVFISKNDANGNFLWAKSIGNSLPEGGAKIVIDVNGDLLVAGIFSGTVDFDPGPGVFFLNSSGVVDVFLLKLASSGNFINAVKFGGTVTEYCRDMIIDVSGNIIITGTFFGGSGDFDPGPSVHTLNNMGSEDIFVVKLNPSFGILWAYSMGGGGIDSPIQIAGTSSGNIIITGHYTGTADFDPSPGFLNFTSQGDFDVFICMLSPSGNLVSAKTFGGAGQDMSTTVSVDLSDNIFVSGYFQNFFDFDPGPGIYTMTAAGNQDGFTVKFNNTLTFQNGISFGGSGSTTQIWDSAIDEFGNIYLLTRYTFTTDANPGSGVYNHISAGALDFYVEKLNASLNYVWSRTAGGATDDLGFCLAYHASGSVVAAGAFSFSANFNPPGSFLLSATGTDIFITKYQTNVVLPVELTELTATCNSDNGFIIHWTVASENNASHYVVERSYDGVHFEEAGTAEASGTSITELNYSLHDPEISDRDRYYRLLQFDQNGIFTTSQIIHARCSKFVSDLHIMPNPAQNYCRVDFGSSADYATLIIYDVTGKVIFNKENINDHFFTIDVSSWNQGLYYIRVEDSQTTIIRGSLLMVGK